MLCISVFCCLPNKKDTRSCFVWKHDVVAHSLDDSKRMMSVDIVYADSKCEVAMGNRSVRFCFSRVNRGGEKTQNPDLSTKYTELCPHRRLETIAGEGQSSGEASSNSISRLFA